MLQYKLGSRSLIVLTTAMLPVFSLVSCDADKPQDHDQLKEVIDVQGSCSANQLGSIGSDGAIDNYAGKIYRWQTGQTRKIVVYGVLFKTNDSVERSGDTPAVVQKVSFAKIDIDTAQPRWTLHGVSDISDNSQEPPKGQDIVCEVAVTNRRTEFDK
jgi:hypothetical protein